jgi:Uma2 family endonuclease
MTIRNEVAMRDRYATIPGEADGSGGRQQMGTAQQRRLFTADEYYRLADVGILRHGERVELLDGDIIEMTPIGIRHAACVDRLLALLQPRMAGRAILRVQNPIRLDSHSEPQPDLSILKARTDFYASGHPTPGDVLLVIEVADSSLQFDREIKVPLYARSGIPEVWLVDLEEARVDIFAQPADDGYRRSHAAVRGERVTCAALPGFSLSVDEILL